MLKIFASVGLCLLLPFTALAASVTVEPMPASRYARGELQTSRDVFGGDSGYIHPFLTISQAWTDNFFNEEFNEAEEWITTFSPGLWLAFPGMKTQPQTVTVLNSVAGGQNLTRFHNPVGHRFQGYALYSADIPKHANYPDAEEISHRAEAMGSVDLRGGLGLELVNVYQQTHDPYSLGNTPNRQLDEYTSNLTSFLAEYEVSSKFRLRADVDYFWLEYDAPSTSVDRNREDMSYSGYAFYQPLPKTAFFVQYKYVDIDYEQNVYFDNEESQYYLGVRLNPTSKTSGVVKLGYSVKELAPGADFDALVGELQLGHRFAKGSLNLVLNRKQNESDDPAFVLRETDMVQLAYSHTLTPRMTGSLNASLTRDDYIGVGDRTDTYYGAGAGVSYQFIKWLNAAAGYNYNSRSSDNPGSDYGTNTFYVSVTASL